MSIVGDDAPAPRGFSAPRMRTAVCKDCQREVTAGQRPPGSEVFTYPEAWAGDQVNRGGSRTDRCREHRQQHQHHIAGVAVAYIDLETVGEVGDRTNPSGPLGGLGPLPEPHRIANTPGVDLGRFGFGMDESHIRQMLESLADPKRRVLVVKAGTGTGKSTYMPYRLLDPPEGCFRLADLGPIVVTEPRVQATVGVAGFVGEVMSGAGGVGPGFPVGYQVSGDKNHDASCQLVYVTDGTMINWLREGRLSQIGTVIVDEAHERSTNIDFIMGYLKRELPRYPHLRVVITSATFDAAFYQQYFGGEAVAAKIEIPAVKSIGYGWPLFPELDVLLDDESELGELWPKMAPELKLAASVDEERLITSAWPRYAPALGQGEYRDSSDKGYIEDLHDTTRKLMPLRFKRDNRVPSGQWKVKMPSVLGEFVVELANGLDRAGIFGDILGFLPTGKNIEEACAIIRAGVGDRADVYALLSALPAEEKAAALDARAKGDKRKIVISTNLAETSLTVEGVRFVVDTGLIAQSEWDPGTAQGGIRTKAHSQAGIKQRWGRVGRKAPGWVFPLYTKGQLLELSEDTAPGSTRTNLEQLVMTAKLGGVDDVAGFPWPAAFEPDPPVVLDEAAMEAQKIFRRELARADQALQSGGAVDVAGHPTSLGKELSRFQALGSTAAAIAVMYADRLACVPEVVSILALLNETSLSGPKGLLLDRFDWPDEWRFEAAERHRAIASACEDDAELVLQIMAGWERADPELAPWEPSVARQAWAARWWVDDHVLRLAAEQRRDILASLSPAMKEEVKRFVEPALLQRSRGAISRAMVGLAYQRDASVAYVAAREVDDSAEPLVATIDQSCMLSEPPARVIPLMRRKAFGGDGHLITNLVTLEPWAVDHDILVAPTGHADAMRLLALSAAYARPDTTKDVLGAVLDAWPAGRRARLTFARSSDGLVVGDVGAVLDPFPLPAPETGELDDADGLEEETADGERVTEDDAHPERDRSWPSPNEPLPDDEAVQRTALLDLRVIEAGEAACGACTACLSGTPEHCDNLRQEDTRTARDALEAWRTRATLGIDVSAPLVEIAADLDLDGSRWYEVCGYRVTAHRRPVVMLRADWRADPSTPGPAEHPDLTPGQHLDVVVGPMVRDHRDPLRILTRADGRGRFLLREAATSSERQIEQGQLAISLHGQHRALLDGLVEQTTLRVTVIPRKEAGCATITLLELLHQHLTAANAQISRAFEVELPSGQTLALPFYPALIVGAPNQHGYADVELLANDDDKGLIHGASIFAGGGAAPTVPPPGEPIYLRLNRDAARLQLDGRPLAPIRAAAENEKSLLLVHEAPADIDTSDLTDTEPVDPAAEIGALNTALISRGPVPRAALDSLLALDPDRAWQSRVWQFWARSRHVRTDRRDPYRPGDLTKTVHVPAVLAAELPPRLHLTLADAQARYPVGTKVEAVVDNVRDDKGRAWLRLPDGVQATLAKVDAGVPLHEQLSSALGAGMAVAATVAGVVEHRGEVQVKVYLGDAAEAPPPELTLDEALSRYPPGARVSATVERVSDEIGRAWLRLEDTTQATVGNAQVGVGGILRLSDALYDGQVVAATVTNVGEHRDKVQVTVSLRDLPTKPYHEQLADAGIVAGARLTGKVVRQESFGVFVEVTRGTNGLIHRSQLPGFPVVAPEPGTEITVLVLDVSEDPNKPGRMKIGLRPV